ncbi:monovalent cation/H(+) antiporter subunit G [Streptomyces radicis]|uniref:Monovalent cation/H(+) antiporter subunit G n=1 Tax=Streptomyces radicis TaxID=1750517 RepID=A0A3A9W315_9ACTN|nr:monovalent cation/H(+) antiporter subunit G [Streptomyces radicis]RKN07578.1 monovalent cation/H(+) antiporter subunit G [Streptomyces radicis]RKN18301.1 monovalent cation/H(+) antiporter subunit G [Streptomyces radicis]
MRAALDVLSAVLLLTGAAFCVLTAVGVLRFPDPVCRLHAAAKAQTLGVLLILGGTACQVSAHHIVSLALVAVFQLATVPVVGQVVGRTAYRTGAVHRESLVADELEARLAEDERGG